MTSHRDCTHPKTKAARALCRKIRAALINRVTTDCGTFETKVIPAREIKKTDMILYQPRTISPFFSGVTYDAFQIERYSQEAGGPVKVDVYRLSLGGPDTFVPGDTEYTVAVDPQLVKQEMHRAHRELLNKFHSR